MTLARWNPLREMDDLMTRVDRAFGRRSLGEGAQETIAIADWAPSVDISETEGGYRLKVELTGVPKEEEGRRYHRVERAYGRFARTFVLPENVDESNINAAHKDGLLTVTLGKTPEVKPKSIEVKVA